MKNKRPISKRQLQNYLNELVALAKTVTPNIETTVHVPGYEGQNAWIEIYAPDELVDQIEDLVCERADDILIETGYDIGTIVFEKSELQDLAA
jgi:hypothetical protein